MVKKFKVTENVIPKAVSEILAFINSSSAIILLEGDLASGKTTLIKKFVQFFEVDDEVTSPTFTIQNIYGTNIYHYDIYQKSINEFVQLGLFDMLSESGYHLIEWGNSELANLLKMYGFSFYHIKITAPENSYRIYQVSDQWQD
jgi:tRNA threonylcarbamoyladenosine biosynthesis protein TsaE